MIVEAVNLLVGDFSFSLVAFLGVSAVLLLVALGLYDGRFLLAISILAYSLPLVTADLIPAQPNLYLGGAFGLMLLLGMTRASMPEFNLLKTGAFPATGAYLVIGVMLLGASADTGESITTAMSVVLAVVYTWLMLSVCTPDEIRSSFRIAAGLFVALSLFFVVFVPSVGIGSSNAAVEAGRWRGVMENPNGLGVMAVLLIMLSSRQTSSLRSLLLTAVVLVGSGSRSSALGLGVMIWPRIFARSSRVVRRTTLVIAVLIAVPLLYGVLFTDGAVQSDDGTGVLRTKNTRAESWGYATTSIGSHLVGGLGMGNDVLASGDREMGVTSSVLRPMTELGLPALIPLGMVLALGVRFIRAPESPFRTVVAFMMIHGVFEGWLFAGGSVVFALFLAATALVDLDLSATRQRHRNDERNEDGATDEQAELSNPGSRQAPLGAPAG